MGSRVDRAGMLVGLAVWLQLGPLVFGVAAEDVAVLALGAADGEALSHLETLSSEGLVRHESSSPRDPRAVLAQADAEGWAEPRIVILDSEAGAVHVLHRRDGAILTRLLSDPSVQRSPYAVAFVVAELLGLSQQMREWKAEPDTAGAARGGDGHRGWRTTVGLGAQVAGRGGPVFVRVQLDGLVRLGRADAPVWAVAGARVAALGRQTSEVDSQQLRVRHHDAGLSLGFGFGSPGLAWMPMVRAGASYQDASILRGRRTDRVLSGWSEAGLQVRLQLADSVAVLASAEVRWTPVATRYRWQGQELLGLGHLGLSAGIGLAWSDGP